MKSFRSANRDRAIRLCMHAASACRRRCTARGAAAQSQASLARERRRGGRRRFSVVLFGQLGVAVACAALRLRCGRLTSQRQARRNHTTHTHNRADTHNK